MGEQAIGGLIDLNASDTKRGMVHWIHGLPVGVVRAPASGRRVSAFWITYYGEVWGPRGTGGATICCVAYIAPGLASRTLLIGIGVMVTTGAAAQGTPKARQACTPDAMRLC